MEGITVERDRASVDQDDKIVDSIELAECIRKHKMYPQLLCAAHENSIEGLSPSAARKPAQMLPPLSGGDGAVHRQEVDQFVMATLLQIEANTEKQRQAQKRVQEAGRELISSLSSPLKARMDTATRTEIPVALGVGGGVDMRRRFTDAVRGRCERRNDHFATYPFGKSLCRLSPYYAQVGSIRQNRSKRRRPAQ